MTARDDRARSSQKRTDDEAAVRTRSSERAQAKSFAKMLRRELAEISEKVLAAEVEWHLRCEAEGFVDPPARLVLVRERMTEIEQMLSALRARFPRV